MNLNLSWMNASVARIEHHYVFHLVREDQCPLILAVLHENMDLMNRLRDRLVP